VLYQLRPLLNLSSKRKHTEKLTSNFDLDALIYEAGVYLFWQQPPLEIFMYYMHSEYMTL